MTTYAKGVTLLVVCFIKLCYGFVDLLDVSSVHT